MPDKQFFMLFNSFRFLLFFPFVCFVYFLLGKNKYRNPFLLIASYFFYMNWKPVYAVLILCSTVLTFAGSLLMEKYADNKQRRKTVLIVNLLLNLGILFGFKYFNFINENVFDLLSYLRLRWTVPNLDILLPVGISFYTFQAIGYSIDVYRGTVKAERDFPTYALFVSFFPQLVAGPIERAKNLLPQFHTEHRFDADDVAEGFRLMVWGFFMKLCVADVLSDYVDAVYNNVAYHNGTSMLLATFFFAFQIYCDFAGYSNIAIGSARIMGFRLMENFRQPYFSTSIKEFWKRWHISLSSWFADYLYIPLGGNRVKYGRHLINLMITFLVSGLWHGANWTFVFWGFLHGSFLIVESILRKCTPPKLRQRIPLSIRTLYCFILVCFAWIFFRANTLPDAFSVIHNILANPGPLFVNREVFFYGLIPLCLLIFKDTKDAFGVRINFLHSNHLAVRIASAAILIAYIMLFGALNAGSFIYFQF